MTQEIRLIDKLAWAYIDADWRQQKVIRKQMDKRFGQRKRVKAIARAYEVQTLLNPGPGISGTITGRAVSTTIWDEYHEFEHRDLLSGHPVGRNSLRSQAGLSAAQKGQLR